MMRYTIENRNNDISSAFSFTSLSPIPHLHTHLELAYLAEGASVATLDYREFLIGAGDLFLAFPNQIHLYHDLQPCQGSMVIFSNDFFGELKDLFQKKVPLSPVIPKDLLPADIRLRMETIMEKALSDRPYDRLAAKGYLLALLCDLLPLMELQPSPCSYDSVKNILHFCSEKYTQPLSLDILSRELHLNKYYVSHLFKERMKISFTDFINGMRVEHACGLLETDPDITEAAFSSGFNSMRTFNRAFLKVMKMTPREYLRKGER